MMALQWAPPSSSLIAEIFLQHTENTHLARLSHKHKIINYFRYVDDILLIFDPDHTDIQAILTDFNTLHPNLAFTAEIETDVIHYLDISIHKTPKGLKTAIFRKPTFTDTIIPYMSNNPTQHKYTAVRFLYNRLNSYNLQKQEYDKELNVIHNILHNNSFPVPTHKQHPHNTPQQQLIQTSRRKWANFTYIGKEKLYITNACRHTDLKIAFRTNNILENLLKETHPLTNFHHLESTNSPAQIAIRPTYDRPEDASLNVTTNTKGFPQQ